MINFATRLTVINNNGAKEYSFQRLKTYKNDFSFSQVENLVNGFNFDSTYFMKNKAFIQEMFKWDKFFINIPDNENKTNFVNHFIVNLQKFLRTTLANELEKDGMLFEDISNKDTNPIILRKFEKGDSFEISNLFTGSEVELIKSELNIDIYGTELENWEV